MEAVRDVHECVGDSLARRDDELVAVHGVIDGGDGPGDADAQEHVHSVAAGHVAHRVVSCAVLDRGHLAGERVFNIHYIVVSTGANLLTLVMISIVGRFD